MAKKKKNIETTITWHDIKNKVFGLCVATVILIILLVFQSRIMPDITVKPDESFIQRSFDLKKSDSEITFKDADIIFQKAPGEISRRVGLITESEITHCGLIFIEEDNIYVLEAWRTVRIKPVETWVQNGINKKFALLRDETLTLKQRENIIAEGKKFLGRPYDFQFEPDDKKLYCSELVHKAYKNATGINLGKPIKLKKLKYKGHEAFIRLLTPGGKLKLEREIITPVQLYKNKKLVKIYDDFLETSK
jgi:uncharacterized protein YycO